MFPTYSPRIAGESGKRGDYKFPHSSSTQAQASRLDSPRRVRNVLSSRALLSRETRSSLLNPAITSSTEQKGRALISVIRSPESGDIREPIPIVVRLQVSCTTAESQPNSCETAMNLPTRESDSRMSRVIYRINSELVAVAKIHVAISTDPHVSPARKR